MFSLPIVPHSNDTSIMILAFIVFEKSDFLSINPNPATWGPTDPKEKSTVFQIIISRQI